METQMFVEIDVSKAKLDVALRPDAEQLQRDQQSTQRRDPSQASREVDRESCIVLEANGGYEITAANELAAAGLLVALRSVHARCATLRALQAGWRRPC